MSRVCSVCSNAGRASIDRALASGSGSNRRIAAQFGISLTALRRHRDDHVPAQVSRDAEARRAAEAVDVVAALHETLRLANSGLARAFEQGNLMAASSFLGRRIDVLGMVHRVQSDTTLSPDRIRQYAVEQGLDPELVQLEVERIRRRTG